MERRGIHVRGVVQGVGFRPYVYGLASKLSLHGFVKRSTNGLIIEVEGEGASLDRFESELRASPPLAMLEAISTRRLSVLGEASFRVEDKTPPARDLYISPDLATCGDCLAELLNPVSRRYRYPFISCGKCGPRLTIVWAAPYDRAHTTMAGFEMCRDCRREYEDPFDRRFHAQTIGCPVCGPQLSVRDADGRPLSPSDPISYVVGALHAGHIVAIKGLDGYNLVCDAANADAIAELRRRNGHDEKPFPVMVRDPLDAATFCQIAATERALLESAARPVVLLERKLHSKANHHQNTHTPDHIPAPHPSVAAWQPCLGVMLPPTPLEHLLALDMRGKPLVVTGGNRPDETLADDDADAVERLRGLADVFLTDDRPIHFRCPTSVSRIVAGAELPVRRSRGYAPAPLTLPFECPLPILAVGGRSKNTFALGRGRHAFLSQHIGDLNEDAAYARFLRDLELYGELFGIQPEVTAHDLHPDYPSTRYAKSLESGIRVGVQHHHAHVAACMAEHGLEGPVMGVAFDGAGYGDDGSLWGGEFLVGGYRQVGRAAHLRSVAMPGGDAAIHEPWRMAVSHLFDAGERASEHPISQRLAREHVKMVERLIAGTQAPMTSSAGRLIDAVAALIGIRDHSRFDGQAAMQLEWVAAGLPANGSYPFEIETRDTLVVDTRPLILAIARDVRDGVAPPVVARRFHSTLVDVIVRVSMALRTRTGLDHVVLSGGVFLNAMITREAVERLSAEQFRVFHHRRVPPGDGGLSLGQLAVAAARQRDGKVSLSPLRS